jgi:hypothetical protein
MDLSISNRDLPLREVVSNRDLPKDIQYIIASYVVPPVYRLADRFANNINWDELCYNRHPGMITLIDAYFERCLTIQSHLDWCMLHRLSSNPTALPLLEKYKYHLIQGKIDVDWNTIYKNINPQIHSLYQNPAIFELDSVSTKKAQNQFITEIFN